MSPKLINLIFSMLGLLVIIFIIMIIWFIIWRIIERPIKLRDDILKKRDDAKIELQEIQVEKAVEWDKYKDLTDELDRVRMALISEKKSHENLLEKIAKNEVHLENLKAVNKQLKNDANTTKKT